MKPIELRENRLKSKKYIELLREQGISPERQLKDINRICFKNIKLGEQCSRLILNDLSSYSMNWRMQCSYQTEMVLYRNGKRWSDITKCFKAIQHDLFRLLEVLDRRFCDYIPDEFYQQSKMLSLSDEQFETVAREIVSNWNVESQEEADIGQMEEQGYGETHYDTYPKFHDPDNFLIKASDEEVEALYKRIAVISVSTTCDVGREIKEAMWCKREVEHFCYRMRNRNIRSITKAFISTQT